MPRPILSLTVSATVFLSVVSAQLVFPPPRPLVYPPPDQLQYLSGPFLQDPLITAAYDHVVKTVNPTLLALQPSTQFSFGNVSYPLSQAPETAYCHWGIETQCVRRQDTADFKADILTCPQPFQWGLTYDDGPNGVAPGTADVRAALKTANLKATFFVLGTAVTLFGDELKATYADGHQIASHSWTHRPFTNLTNQQIVAEIKYTESMIYETIGVVPTMFRPPYGDVDDRVRAILNALGYRVVIWTTIPDIIRDTEDTIVAYQQAGIEALTANVTKWFTDPVSQTRGFISLEHDASNFTASLAVSIINAFAASGSQLKPQTVAQCTGLEPYRPLTNVTTTLAPTGPATVSITSAGPASATASSSPTRSPITTTSAAGKVGPSVLVAAIVAAAALML